MTQTSEVAAATVTVGRQPLDPAEVVAVARHGAQVVVAAMPSSGLRRRDRTSRRSPNPVSRCTASSTGFGALATRHIAPDLRAQLQRSLVRSHAAGSGTEVEREVVRAMMLLRLATLATGRTGVRPLIATGYAAMLNAGCHPGGARVRLAWVFR